MQQRSKRPSFITSYSSGYEHSVERLLETRRLVQAADKPENNASREDRKGFLAEGAARAS